MTLEHGDVVRLMRAQDTARVLASRTKWYDPLSLDAWWWAVRSADRGGGTNPLWKEGYRAVIEGNESQDD